MNTVDDWAGGGDHVLGFAGGDNSRFVRSIDDGHEGTGGSGFGRVAAHALALAAAAMHGMGPGVRRLEVSVYGGDVV